MITTIKSHNHFIIKLSHFFGMFFLVGLFLCSCISPYVGSFDESLSANSTAEFSSKNDSSNSSDVNEIEGYPLYFEEHLKNKIYAIDKIKILNRIDYSFAFVTDLHWETNTKMSPLILKNIRMRTQIDKTILGGDYSSYDRDDTEQSKVIMKSCVDSFIYGDYTAILGNHDTNCNLNNGTPAITPEEAYGIVNNTITDRPYSCDLNYEKKLCSFYLYSGTNVGSFDYEGQKESIYDIISSLDESWYIIAFIHIIFSGSGNNDGLSVLTTAGQDFFDFFDSLKKQFKRNYIGVFSGHSHMDLLDSSNYSIPVVTTMCDSIGFYNQTSNIYFREKGTYTEQAFDIVQISFENRKVFLTRIGAGSDRVFNF